MKKKIMLCVLNAYEKESIADINFENLTCVGLGKDKMKNYINQLIDSGDVINLSHKGFYPRYKVLTKVECPNFLLDDTLTISNKIILMDSIDKITNFTPVPAKELSRLVYNVDDSSTVKRFYSIKENSGKTIFEILANVEYVKCSPSHDKYKLKSTEFGMQIDSYVPEDKECLCQHCGESNPENFYKGNKCTCRKCAYSRSVEKLHESPEKLLMSKVKGSSKQRAKLKKILITKEDIKDQLEKQNYKDYYTGLELDNVELMSVDRVDSAEHYEMGNIVITDRRINMMKNDLSVEEFKKFIIDIYNNIDNF